MNFPKLSDSKMIEMLEVPKTGKLNVVIDTDTYNEIDDQFALAYALRSEDRLNVEAVYAAPFTNDRAATAKEGMEKSYDEIFNVLNKIDRKDIPVFKGSDRYLESLDTPCKSPAALDLIDRALKAEEPLYVIALGAIVNIASAILLKPEIIEKIVVVWLAGNSYDWPGTRVYNMQQDLPASQLIFDCGVPLIHVPCAPVTSHLAISIPEMREYLGGKGEVADYFYEMFCDYVTEEKSLSKSIWDIGPVALMINPDWVPTMIFHSAMISENFKWAFDNERHLMRNAFYINRDAVYRDLFAKLTR